MPSVTEENSILEKFFPPSYVVVDIETTGVSPTKNEIIELSAIRVVDNKAAETFSTLIKPKGRISSFITSLTGISNEMVCDKKPIENILGDFCNFVGSSVVLGHNVRFDVSFIRENCKKILGTDFSNPTIDTLRISRFFLPEVKNHKLATLAEHYNISTAGHHRGLVDCEITYQLHQRLRCELDLSR